MRNSGDTDAPTTRLAPGLNPVGIAIFATSPRQKTALRLASATA